MPDDIIQDRRLDDDLAAFTDRVLAREAAGEPQLDLEREELRKLQEVVLRLKKARTDRPPSPAFATRLRALMQQEWHRNGTGPMPAHPAPDSLLQKIRHFFDQSRQRKLALQFATLAIVLLLVVLFVTPPPGSTTLTGAAGAGALLKPVVIVFGLLLVGLVIWLERTKDK